jgi:hypothetical protein
MHYRSSKFLALTGEVSSLAMCWLLWVDESACANTCVVGCWQQQQQQQQQLRRVETLETNNDSPVTHGSSSSGGWGYSGGSDLAIREYLLDASKLILGDKIASGAGGTVRLMLAN